ncbi:MAG: cardiolipin synthase [Planctomycetia bacterium]|nr:cardiolipin synthase [Planctomycetia bacterium]
MFPLFESTGWFATTILVTDWLIRVGLSIRIIMRNRPVGITLAWLAIVLIFPFGGAALYLLFGELRLGSRRADWAARIHGPFQQWLADLSRRTAVDWTKLGNKSRSLAQLCSAAVGIPAMPDNELELLMDAQSALRALVADIDAAQRTCHLEFYIWNEGGTADDVVAALVRAAGRGVTCRVLVDAVGSHDFLRGALATRMREGGVQLHAALPVGLTRMLFYRLDLRMHRKIAVIDGEIAYTGSMNLVDPRYFKQNEGVGEWIDAMVRMRGPAVEALAVTFLEDWELETSEGLERLRETGDVHAVGAAGAAVVQVVPSGPVVSSQSIQSILITAIYGARDELILTTPYFVPDELLLAAILSAAGRGVNVTIVLPKRVDSRLVRLASQAHKGELLAAGVRIVLFGGGLLHTKSITVDGKLSLVGSMNLDPRSLQLNFEITLAVYDEAFTQRLRALQTAYINRSTPMDLARWQSRSALVRFTDQAARLLSPLL